MGRKLKSQKRWKREGEGRREEETLPSLFIPLLCSHPNFLDERVRKCLLRRLLWGGGRVGAYEWQLLSGRRQVMVYMLTIHNWTVYLRLRSWFIRNRHCIDWSVRVICVTGVWTWWWSYQSQKHSGYRALKKCSPVGHLGVFYIWNKKMFVLVQSDFRNGQIGNTKTCNLDCNIAAKRVDWCFTTHESNLSSNSSGCCRLREDVTESRE